MNTYRVSDTDRGIYLGFNENLIEIYRDSFEYDYKTPFIYKNDYLTIVKSIKDSVSLEDRIEFQYSTKNGMYYILRNFCYLLVLETKKVVFKVNNIKSLQDSTVLDSFEKESVLGALDNILLSGL